MTNMASKPMLFLFATLLLLTSKVTNGDTEPSTTYPPKTTPTTPVVNPPNPVVKPPPVSVSPPVALPPPETTKPTPVPQPLPAPPVAVAPPTVPRQPPVKSLRECQPLCDTRCSLHSRKNVCRRACVTCCYRCKCVPPGTYGNQEMCGTCYSRMKTKFQRLKCP